MLTLATDCELVHGAIQDTFVPFFGICMNLGHAWWKRGRPRRGLVWELLLLLLNHYGECLHVQSVVWVGKGRCPLPTPAHPALPYIPHHPGLAISICYFECKVHQRAVSSYLSLIFTCILPEFHPPPCRHLLRGGTNFLPL